MALRTGAGPRTASSFDQSALANSKGYAVGTGALTTTW